jgi:Ferritin-like domain
MNDLNSNPLLTRRHILAGAAAIGAGLVAAACGSDNDDGAPTTSPAGTTGSTSGSGTTAPTDTMAPVDTMAPTETSAPDANVDVSVANLAASLEVLAVGTYKAALDAAGAGALGDVPPAVAEFVTVAMAQHQEHLDAWNGVITGAGGSAVTEPNATLKPVVDDAFGKVTDVVGAAQLALMLEQIASATYLNAQNVLTDKDAIELAGSIQIVDAQHAAVLLYVLGEYPVPDVFAKVDMAAAA